MLGGGSSIVKSTQCPVSSFKKFSPIQNHKQILCNHHHMRIVADYHAMVRGEHLY